MEKENSLFLRAQLTHTQTERPYLTGVSCAHVVPVGQHRAGTAGGAGWVASTGRVSQIRQQYGLVLSESDSPLHHTRVKRETDSETDRHWMSTARAMMVGIPHTHDRHGHL
uniref:Uncharacterized protein n=1 Tax=Vitrella brassicaformis TaxID=1169539 RepID=A0A6U4H292_9ALVE|mmetsp:Transcript_4523/g.10482  ORF Transcript_4523/g.10482 Transcript_4523/m.10482 type:complete len:111 (+) Transcript_4523:356-688(+)